MWRPSDFSEITAMIGSATETPSLDFKRELTTNSRELAKDIAAMTIDGGVLLYGVDEDSSGVATAVPKIALGGAEERVRLIAQTNIRPAPSFEVIELRANDGDADGVLAVVIPPSPLAPHEVANRFPRRDGTTTAYMTEPEIERLYNARHQYAQQHVAATDLLDDAVHLPGVDPAKARSTPGEQVAHLRVACAPAGAAAHAGGAWLQQPLADAVNRAEAWMAPRSNYGVSALLSRLKTTGWRADGVEGWFAGWVSHDYPKLLKDLTAAATMRHPALLLTQVTFPLCREGEGDGFISYPCAYETYVIREAVAALVLAGEWAAHLQPSGIINVALQLAGFADAAPITYTHAREGISVEGMDKAPHGIVSMTSVPALSLRQTPVEVARTLIDRWLAAFYTGRDLYAQVIDPQ
jgi:hypothetical protein